MQQQQQQRQQLTTRSVNLLAQTEEKCKAWQKQQSISEALLASLSNVLAQRSAAADNVEILERHSVDPERLAYKQTQAFERTLQQLSRVLENMSDIAAQLQKLEQDAAKHLQKAATLQSSSSNNKNPPALSSESLIQVAAIPPDQVHDYVSSISYMYTQELRYKQTWISLLPRYTASSDQMDELQRYWQAQPHIDKAVEQDMSERLKLYKQVKKTVESKDWNIPLHSKPPSKRTLFNPAYFHISHVSACTSVLEWKPMSHLKSDSKSQLSNSSADDEVRKRDKVHIPTTLLHH